MWKNCHISEIRQQLRILSWRSGLSALVSKLGPPWEESAVCLFRLSECWGWERLWVVMAGSALCITVPSLSVSYSVGGFLWDPSADLRCFMWNYKAAQHFPLLSFQTLFIFSSSDSGVNKTEAEESVLTVINILRIWCFGGEGWWFLNCKSTSFGGFGNACGIVRLNIYSVDHKYK